MNFYSVYGGRESIIAMPVQEAKDPVMAYVMLVILVPAVVIGALGLVRNWRKGRRDSRMARGVIAYPFLIIFLLVDLLILHVL